MQSIKQSPFLRPISRNSSPAPVSQQHLPDPVTRIDVPLSIPMARTSSKGPLNRLSLSSLRGRAPSPTPAPTPAASATLVQDGTYLEALGLKISEAITRALAPALGPTPATLPDDTFNGRRPLPAGRGAALGAVIAAELKAAKENPQLSKAITRLLQRPLSVLLTNVSAQLLPALTSPKFQLPEGPNGPNAAQAHALALAAFAAELIRSFDELRLGINNLGETRGDGLQTVRDGLAAIVSRVLNPLTFVIKQDVLPHLAELERSPDCCPLIKSPASFKTGAQNQVYHPTIHALQSRLQIHNKALRRYYAIAGTSYDSQLASLIISFIWRALAALAHRPVVEVLPPTPPATVGRRRGSPPGTPRIGLNFMLSSSRPPSPTAVLGATRAGDAKAVYDILQSLPRPAATNLDASEAIDEGFDDLQALVSLFEALASSSNRLEGLDLDALTDELPPLIALPVLLSATKGVDEPIRQDIWSLIGLEEKEYRQTCLASFGREEECAETILRKLQEVFATTITSNSLISKWIAGQLE